MHSMHLHTGLGSWCMLTLYIWTYSLNTQQPIRATQTSDGRRYDVEAAAEMAPSFHGQYLSAAL